MKVGEIIASVVETIIKLALFIFLAMMISRGALMAYDYGYRIFTEDPISVGEGRIISVEIKQDMSAKDIGEMLQKKGLIRDSKIFFLQEFLSEYKGKEVPGIYDLSTAMTAEEMLAIMSADADSVDIESESDQISTVSGPEEEIISEDDTLADGNIIGDASQEEVSEDIEQ